MAFWNVKNDFIDTFCQTFKKLYPSYTDAFKETRRILPTYFYEIIIILIPKTDNGVTRTESYRPIYIIIITNVL